MDTQTITKISKKSCLELIAQKALPYSIKRIAQTDRLVPTASEKGALVNSRPIISWAKLYAELDAMPSLAQEVLHD